MNYFTLFNLPENFKINQKLLSENFYRLQLKFHPDLFINHSDMKKKIILKKSIEINKGYKTLKDFLSRAIYLLFLNGYKLDTENVLLNNNCYLTKYFVLYEDIDDLKKNNFDKEQLNSVFTKIMKEIMHCKNNIELEFKKKNYKNIIPEIEQLLFLKKIKFNLMKERNIYLRQEN
ncbi:Fe-S protein assembly co-chaperone HscB [Buchnera aphidicola (Macrosiphoniella sanborni)]|uniref:Co-chaperone protein HscB n=1 Tax=Buchnera aphidicola (Macrosiphoniella sanborni) TaxID=1241865 RepID=A0A4D6Y3F3_9GAMM|nr:Fe-S protein assembly co-chaperone HscB [Buchnera aphidicola]QCI24116.1 Fe-S protein assembly co-chaperone HscB [Buchnera aphidicola (Macrosiphoniella sanborni)]